MTGVAAFLAGVLSFLSPCVLPMVPVYLSYLSGVSVTEMKESKAVSAVRRRLFWNSAWFILGFSLVFIVIFGTTASLLGILLKHFRLVIFGQNRLTGETFWRFFTLLSPSFYAENKELFRLGFMELGGILVIFFGLYLLGVFRVPFLSRYAKFELKGVKKGGLGAFLIGATFALGWTPCVGPILSSILLLAANEASLWKGIFHMVVYSAGMAVPFLSLTWGLTFSLRLYQRWAGLVRWTEIISGILLIVLGLFLFTNNFSQLNTYIAFLNEWVPLEKIEQFIMGGK
ncbi:MAG: cytochrome c biogenesis CcdA family protein [bacterium JZ-2024 1]